MLLPKSWLYMSDNQIDNLALELGQALVRRRWRIATAESCTGGWIAQAITSVPGSSKWFEQGFITYSNEAKCKQLNVKEKVLKDSGAVSSAVVIAMATSALERAVADIAVAVSGIAGPDGGSEEKPVGTVWIAWAISGEKHFSRLYHFTGGRSDIRQQTVVEALKGILVLLEKNTV